MSSYCFLAASSSLKLSTLRDVLADRGVQVLDIFDLVPGWDPAATLRSHIRKADFVIVVLDRATPSVYYEAGIGDALGKPFLILGQPSRDVAFLHAHPSTPVDLDSREVLGIAVDKLIEESKR